MTGAPAASERQIEILRLVAAGRSNPEIGRELFLSPDTVKTHLRLLSRAWGVNGRAALVATGIREGVI